MRTLAALLERIQKSLGKDVFAKEGVLACIKEIFGFELLPEHIAVKGDALEIHTSLIKKNEIRLKEAKILAAINERCNLSLKKILYR
jgi:hypothetical protein